GPVAEHVRRERHVAHLRELARAHLRVIVEAPPFVDDQDAGMRALLRVVPREVSLEGLAFLLVCDFFRDDLGFDAGASNRQERAGERGSDFHGVLRLRKTGMIVPTATPAITMAAAVSFQGGRGSPSMSAEAPMPNTGTRSAHGVTIAAG